MKCFLHSARFFLHNSICFLHILLCVLVVGTYVRCTLPTEEEKSLTPTMGWSSWNTFALGIDAKSVVEQADYMVSSGLSAAGYQYVNIDDGYFGGRDSTGVLNIHPEKFPEGLLPVVNHIHSLGLKAGIYTDAGANTCGAIWGGNTQGESCGLLGHEEKDLDLFFNKFDFDFIKVDYCGGYVGQRTGDISCAKDRYTSISECIHRIAKKDVRMNVCTGAFPGTWAADVAGSWRTTSDIYCSWASVKSILKQCLYLSAYSSPGHFNDMDMLEVGKGLSYEEDCTHFGMWCILCSPLLIGCDMTTLSDSTLALITNPELIALNQDPLGRQAYVAGNINGCYVLVKDIGQSQGKERAVALLNLTDEPVFAEMPFDLVDLAGKVSVRNLFERKEEGCYENSFSTTIPAHGTRIYRLKAAKRLERTIYEAETALNPSFQRMSNYESSHTGIYEYNERCRSGIQATWLGTTEDNCLIWDDVYTFGGDYELYVSATTPNARKVFVEVDGSSIGELSWSGPSYFMGTGVAQPLRIHLKKGWHTVRMSNPTEYMPDIDYMQLRKL